MNHKEVFKNSTYQVLSRIVTSGAGFLITIIIARSFGVLGYGDYTKITVFVGLFYLLLDFGLNAIFLQKKGKEINFRNLFYTRILLSILLLIAINLISIFLPFNKQFSLGFSQNVRQGITIFSFILIAQAILLSSSAIFQKKLQYRFLTRSNIIGSLVSLILILAFIYLSFPLNSILIALVLGAVVSAILSLIWSGQKILPLELNLSISKKLILESLPLGLMLVFNLIYFRIDIFLLSILRSTTDVGIYGLSYKFFDFVIALPLFLSNSLYPFFLASGKNPRKLFKITKIYFLIFLAISILTSIVFWFTAPFLSLIKKEFVDSVLPLRILLLSLPFFFLTSLLQWILISQGKQKFLMLVYLFSAMANVTLNFIFIPSYSYIASAIITGVSEVIIFIFLLIKIIALQKNIQIEKTI
ncbi:MAG: oligosaccharide flippase family protein [Candidatus Levybacteria bacterium]|nr:oligosaccharide flippase family protein [Candidatus Levybacteria bacterium]